MKVCQHVINNGRYNVIALGAFPTHVGVNQIATRFSELRVETKPQLKHHLCEQHRSGRGESSGTRPDDSRV